MSARILLLEDDESLKLILSRALSSAGYQVRATASIDAVLNWVRTGEGDLLLADVLLDGASFLDSIAMVKRLRAELPVIVMSAQTTASTAIDAEKGGVYEYLPKPFDLDQMLVSVAAALGEVSIRRPEKSAAEPSGFIGQSAAMQSTFKSIARAATSRAHVVINGEPGAGKRQAADALIRARQASSEPVVLITPSHSIQEVFASTASSVQALWLHLDEWSTQQQNAARDALDAGPGRVIATVSTPVRQGLDARLLARLSECVITVPPLRERRSDIAALCETFLAEFAQRDRQPLLQLAPAALTLIESAAWPGNVAELRSVLSRLTLATRGRLAAPDDVSRAIQTDTAERPGQLADRAASLASSALTEKNARQLAIDALDRALFAQALARADGNRSRAAQLLGLNRNTLARRLAELGNDS
ncbi:response regulator [uncultured Maricaulis sp.]|uniref:sigma-54-dependent transcriptional regulator n=1 Tax=uncultured Maricaulis sp. TaxID=174710 RepID=UPI0030DCF2B9|tara:strand:- start:128993 stop:130249 length:1257 start_codon:yes stop_codon:yes gene_type:complete